jgi:hypothetical protein
MSTVVKLLLVFILSTALCRLVYASDAFSMWINSTNGVRFFAPLAHRLGAIGPEDDENIMLVVVFGLCSLPSILAVLGARALTRNRG